MTADPRHEFLIFNLFDLTKERETEIPASGPRDCAASVPPHTTNWPAKHRPEIRREQTFLPRCRAADAPIIVLNSAKGRRQLGGQALGSSGQSALFNVCLLIAKIVAHNLTDLRLLAVSDRRPKFIISPKHEMADQRIRLKLLFLHGSGTNADIFQLRMYHLFLRFSNHQQDPCRKQLTCWTFVSTSIPPLFSSLFLYITPLQGFTR